MSDIYSLMHRSNYSRLILDLNTAIRNNDEDAIRILLENPINSEDTTIMNYVLFNTAYLIKNYNIIKLFFKYLNSNSEKYKLDDICPFFIDHICYISRIDHMNYQTDTEAETMFNIIIDNIKTNVLDELVKHENFNKLISALNDLRQDRFKIPFQVEDEIYVNIKDVLEKGLFSLIFRSCALREVDKLRETLHNLKINKINGKPIDNINSETELCDLIEHGLNVNIHKYDNDSYEMEIDPRLKFID
jgi:hypothetical protein